MELHKPTVRVLKILKLIDENQVSGISQGDISRKLIIAKGTLSPILKTLMKTDYIVQNNEGLYFIGPSSFELGLSFGSNKDVLSMIQEKMRKIVQETNEICQMGVLQGLDVLYLLKESPQSVISIISNVGDRIPAHVSGLGKALLSGKTDKELDTLYESYNFKKYTPNSINNFDELKQQIFSIRKNVIAFDNEESKQSVCCIAVPLIIDGNIKAALSVTVPKYRFTEEKSAKIERILKKNKKLIEDICAVQNYHVDF